MLRKDAVRHLLQSVHAITRCRDLVIVGSGALIATAKNLPGSLMLTPEIDIYARDAEDPEDIADLIEATLGSASQFFKTYNYYADAVSPETAIMPADWTERAKAPTFQTSRSYCVTCPSNEDLALSKICAWRDKDVEWLKECLRFGLIHGDKMRALAPRITSSKAPSTDEILRRVSSIAKA